jgi:hypothetical protein
METVDSSEMLVTIYQSTVPDNLNLLECALSNVTEKCIKFLIHTQEVLGSNLGPPTNYIN